MLRAPFSEYNFANNFIADVWCSLSLACADIAYTACVYSTWEAFRVGEWDQDKRR